MIFPQPKELVLHCGMAAPFGGIGTKRRVKININKQSGLLISSSNKKKLCKNSTARTQNKWT